MKNNKIPICILVRVSTTKQDYNRQITDLETYCQQMNYDVVHTIKSIVTGNTTNKKREDIQELLIEAKKGYFNKVVVTEISRLGRKPDEIRTLLNQLHALGISVVFRQLGVETLNLEGKETFIARMIVAIHSELAANEREQLSDRIRSGLVHAKACGKTLGRPTGTTIEDKVLLKKYKKVTQDLEVGLSYRQIEKLHGTSRTTIAKIKRAYENSLGGLINV
jgi:DNA invertase Pin-like site-specific DNA recombinase